MFQSVVENILRHLKKSNRFIRCKHFQTLVGILLEKMGAPFVLRRGAMGFNIRLFPLERRCGRKNDSEKKELRGLKYLDRKVPVDYL